VLRKTYDRMMALAESRNAVAWLALEAFCEGIFFPIPPDLMLMPMVLANRRRAYIYALVTVIFSVMGGSVGYAVGYFLEPVGQAILKATGSPNGLESFHRFYSQFGLVVLAMPIPFKLIAIASGLARFPYPTFIIAAAILRGARFLAVAALLRRYGEKVRAFVEQRLALVVSALGLALVAMLLVFKALFH
jgi:membrane protein YqaA with SNARE-associated domain